MTEQYIGSYKILKKVGAGGMAQVFLAVHKDVPNLKVVLKVLSDPRLVERFKQEADKLALLAGNAHICQIKHFFNHGDDIVIAMEYIEGTTLDDIVKTDDKMAIDIALKITADVLSTLSFAHQKGIYHRDIKPSNIMVDQSGQVKIIDFGIAKSETDPNLTIAGSACGTPAYMAPEQFNPADDIQYAPVDIYAVGTTLYYLVTGKLPFEGDNAFSLRDAKMFNDAVPPRKVNPGISKELNDIILKSIDKEPEKRYASAADMREALLAVGGVASVDTEKTVHIKSKSSTPGKPSKSPMGIIIGAAALIAIAAVVYFVFLSGPSVTLPGTPELVSPVDDVEVGPDDITLSWQAVSRSDMRYTVEYTAEDNFLNPHTAPDIQGTTYTIPEPLTTGHYRWRVRAVNDQGSGEFSRAALFSVIASNTGIPQGTLALAIQPSGDVFINDQQKAENQSLYSETVDTGRYIIRVENSASTQKVFVDTLQVLADRTASRQYAFTIPASPPPTPKPKPPVETFGELRIGSHPIHGARIYIDDELQDRVTPNTYKVKVGRHVIRAELTLEGVDKVREQTVSVTPGSSEKIIFDFVE